MGSNRNKYRMSMGRAHSQRGITAIGFLVLAVAFGILALGGIKVIPLYLANMRLSSVMDDLARDQGLGSESAVVNVRTELVSRFAVEGIRDVPREAIRIEQVSGGVDLSINYERRVSFLGDVYLLVVFDKTVQIRR